MLKRLLSFAAVAALALGAKAADVTEICGTYNVDKFSGYESY